MIEVSQISKKYGDRVALDSISFRVEPGEVVGLLGPNGAGKSTTMKIITGYMSPSAGRVQIGGVDIFDQPIEAKKKIGYLPENPPVYLDMYVEDYLFFVAQLKQVPRQNLAALVNRSLIKTQLENVRHRLIGNLSKGYRQRVGLAQAIVSNPEILILDEPTVGLDPKQVAEMRDLIRELKGKHTIILSTHILSEVEAVCDRVVIIHQGRIVAQDKIANIQALRKSNLQINLKVRQAGLTVDNLQKISGVAHVKMLSPLFFQLTIDSDQNCTDLIAEHVLLQKVGIVEISSAESQLEQLFLNLTYGQKNESEVHT
jgi:ABC-2 type transport system ATP-binding protein